MVLVQKLPFFQLSFLGNIGKENVFYDILELKNAFLSYKNKNFKKIKNWHFSKGVNPWFWFKKWPFLQPFFLGNIGQENVFYDILEQKNAFPSYKNRNFKKSKNGHFSKGDNPWFCPNMAISSTFLFRQYKPGKYFLRYSSTKKRLSLL